MRLAEWRGDPAEMARCARALAPPMQAGGHWRGLRATELTEARALLSLGRPREAEPLAAGMFIAHRYAALAGKVHGPMRNFSLLVLVGFVLAALALNWGFFLQYGRFVVVVVFIHNALALASGYGLARAAGLAERDCRAVAFETGIQNSGLGLVLVFNFFGGLGGMAIVTAWWGIWHIVAGMALSTFWMQRVPAGATP